jgi:hypothetical protein
MQHWSMLQHSVSHNSMLSFSADLPVDQESTQSKENKLLMCFLFGNFSEHIQQQNEQSRTA